MSSPELIDEAEVRRRHLISAAEDFEPLFHALWEFGIPADPVPGAPSLGSRQDHPVAVDRRRAGGAVPWAGRPGRLRAGGR